MCKRDLKELKERYNIGNPNLTMADLLAIKWEKKYELLCSLYSADSDAILLFLFIKKNINRENCQALVAMVLTTFPDLSECSKFSLGVLLQDHHKQRYELPIKYVRNDEDLSESTAKHIRDVFQKRV